MDFESFFHKEFERLFRAVCLIVGDQHEAEEVTQEAFAIAWERWDRVARMESPTGYVLTCAVNASRRRFKRALFKLGLTPDLAYRSAMKLGLAHLRLSVGVSNRSSLMKLANALMLSLGFGYEQARGPIPAPTFIPAIESSPQISRRLEPQVVPIDTGPAEELQPRP